MNENNTTTRTLCSGVEVTFRHTDTGVEIQAIEDNVGLVYSTLTDRDFYVSRQTYGTIANAIAQSVSPSFDADAVAESFRDVCMTMRINEWGDDYRPPTVVRLIDQTTAITFHRDGQDSRLVVDLAVSEQEASITFSMGEWTGDDGIRTLEKQYVTAFFPKEVDVTSEHWELLKDEWSEMADVIDEAAARKPGNTE